MAIIPKFSTEIIDSRLAFRCITGIYNANNNPGGYNSPNSAITDITDAYFILTDSAGKITTINVYTDLPSVLTYEGYFYYPLQDLPFEEDIYKIQYVLKDSTTTYTSTASYKLIAPVTYSLLATLYSKVEDKINDSDLIVYLNQVLLAFDFWETLLSLESLEDNNNSKQFITSINRLGTFKKA